MPHHGIIPFWSFAAPNCLARTACHLVLVVPAFAMVSQHLDDPALPA
jgi:hypothetical protein